MYLDELGANIVEAIALATSIFLRIIVKAIALTFGLLWVMISD